MSQGIRRLAAIMYTDMVGYTTLGQRNEALSVALVEEQRKLIRPALNRHNGKEIKTMGDAFLVEFPSALDAIRCAYDIQRVTREFNISIPEDRRLHLRIGVHLGDVIESEGDVSGDAVNVASRIEPLAEDGGVCLSRQVYDHVENKFELTLVSIGTKMLKNVNAPLEVYRMVMPWEEPKATDSTQLDRNRLAVLPLMNMISDSSDQYFADGMTEELITTISKIKGLTVISRTSVMKYKNAGVAIAEIGKQLGVGSILEGSVRKSGSRVRITQQLIDVKTDGHLWSQTYDRELSDVFAVQSDIAKSVADSLQLELLTSTKSRIERGPTRDLEAYTQYLRGRHLMYDRTEKGLEEARTQFELAFTRDPKFAAAYAGFGDCLYLSVQNGTHPGKEMYDASSLMVAKALELDDNSAEAHSTLGGILMGQHQYKKSELEFRRAISLNPSYAQAHHWFALCLTMMGRYKEAFAEIELARSADPFSPVISSASGVINWQAGNDEEALKRWSQTKAQAPGVPTAYFWLTLYYLEKGKIKEAFENLMNPVLSKQLSEVNYKSILAFAYAMSGQREEALKLLHELQDLSLKRYVPAFDFTHIYLALGDDEGFFKYLARQIEEGTSWNIRDYPIFKSKRSDPRFKSLLRAMNLETQIPS